MNTVAAHALWAATYDEAPNPLLALEQRTVLPLLPNLFGCRAVDVACGTGRWARELQRRGAKVLALDRCSEMLRRAPSARCLADARRMPVPDSYADLAICAFAFSYTGPCLGELARITRAGGAVIVTDMHPAAVEAGWTRSFRTGDRLIDIDAQRYTLDSLHWPGLRLVRLIEARFGPPERSLFLRAGKPALYEAVSDVHALFAAMWIRDVD